MNKHLLPIIFSLFLVICGFAFPYKRNIEGAWRIVEVRTVKADGSYTITTPKEGLILFAKGYYSFTWTSHSSSARSWTLSDSTKLNRFNQSIINAGTYELKADTLVTTALYAQTPMFVGGQATFNCSGNGDTLILTGISVFSSEKIANPLYAAGSHIVNKLIRIK
jgi:hypothetical protein